MRRVLTLLFALLFGAGQAGCGMLTPVGALPKPVKTLEERVEEEKPKEERKFYDKIRYTDFKKIDFDKLPKGKIELNSDFKKLLNKGKKFEDYLRFEREVLELADEHITGPLADASASECLTAAMRIVMDKITYEDIDSTRFDLVEKGNIDTYFYLGKGDCDKYADLFSEVFRIFKDCNPNCENIYVTGNFGGDYYLDKEHKWSSVWVVYKDKIMVAFVDLTEEDEAKAIAQYDKDVSEDRIRMLVAESSGDLEKALKFLEKEYKVATSDYLKDLIEKKSKWSSDLYYRKNRSDKYFQNMIDALQDAKGMCMWREPYAKILRRTIWAYQTAGEQEKADELIKEYKETFPYKETKF